MSIFHKRQLVVSSFGTLFIKVASTGLGFLTSIFIARLLGAEGYGVYSLVMPIITILAIIALWGCPTVLVRYLSDYEINNKHGLARGLMSRSRMFSLKLSVVLAVITAVVGYLIFGNEDTVYITLLIATLLLPFWAMLGTESSSLRGFNHTVVSQVPEMIVRPTIFLVILGGLYLWLGVQRIEPYTVMSFQIISMLGALIVAVVLLNRRIPAEIKSAKPQFENRVWFMTGLPLVLTSGMEIFNQKVSLFVLGMANGPTDAGIYQSAINFSILVSFGMASINMVLAPVLARKFAINDTIYIQKLATKTARIMMMFALPVAIGMYFFGEAILKYVYGDEFMMAYSALVILAFAEVANAGMGSPGLMLRMAGHEKSAANGMFVALLVNIVLSAVLVPIYGIIGAGMAAASSTISLKVTNAYSIKRKCGIRSWALG